MISLPCSSDKMNCPRRGLLHRYAARVLDRYHHLYPPTQQKHDPNPEVMLEDSDEDESFMPSSSTTTTTTTTTTTSLTPTTSLNPTTATSTTAMNLSLGDKVSYRYNIVVNRARRVELLMLMQFKCSSSKQKGKRFKEAHDFSIVDEDLQIPNQAIYAYNMTRPKCVICRKIIAKREDRCKFSIVNYHSPIRDCERCGTHVYCLDCFIVLQSALIPGKQPVCFATILTKRGGCRQFIPGVHGEEEDIEQETDEEDD